MTNQTPEDHEIQKVWRNSKALRTAAGCVELAGAGDHHAIEVLMGSFILKVENKRTPAPEVMKWVADAFLRILDKEKADIAFGLSTDKKGRRPLDSKDLETRAEVAHYILSNASPDDHGSISKAVTNAAKKYNVSEGKARQIYDAYRLD